MPSVGTVPGIILRHQNIDLSLVIGENKTDTIMRGHTILGYAVRGDSYS